MEGVSEKSASNKVEQECRMAKRKLLNVRTHLDHIQMILDGLQKNGYSPLLKHEVAVASLVNRALLRKHDEAKQAGNRKDIRVEAK
jgi:hypothetical protein